MRPTRYKDHFSSPKFCNCSNTLPEFRPPLYSVLWPVSIICSLLFYTPLIWPSIICVHSLFTNVWHLFTLISVHWNSLILIKLIQMSWITPSYASYALIFSFAMPWIKMSLSGLLFMSVMRLSFIPFWLMWYQVIQSNSSSKCWSDFVNWSCRRIDIIHSFYDHENGNTYQARTERVNMERESLSCVFISRKIECHYGSNAWATRMYPYQAQC